MNIVLSNGDVTFIFGLNTLMPDSRQRKRSQKISTHKRLGQRDILQHLGSGSDEITMPGVIYPNQCGNNPDQFGKESSLDDLSRIADQGKSCLMIDDQGYVHGRWLIGDITETSTHYDAQARPRKIEFSVKLRRQGLQA